MEETTSAIIGAIFGAIAGGIVSFFIAKMQIDEAKRLSDTEIRKGRAWEIVQDVSIIQADILSSSTPNTLKQKDDVYRLKEDWNRISKRLVILGYKDIESEFSKSIYPYLQSLENFIERKITLDKLDQQRLQVRDRVEKVIKRLQE
jgi:hypothetical protein